MNIQFLQCLTPSLFWPYSVWLLLVGVFIVIQWLLSVYYSGQAEVLERSLGQKLALLGTEKVKAGFTVRNQAGAPLYDRQLALAVASMERAKSCLLRKEWRRACKFLKAAGEEVSEYNLGHIPPYDMPAMR